MARAESYPHAKFQLDRSNRLATVHERYRHTGQADRQRTDSIGRTVLQTVAQKQRYFTTNTNRKLYMVKVIRLLQPTSFVIYHIVVQYLDIIVTDGEDKFYLSMITEPAENMPVPRT